MKRNFDIGDKVEVIDENLSGTVIGLKGNAVVFEDEHGFSHTYDASQLVKKQTIPCQLPMKTIEGKYKETSQTLTKSKRTTSKLPVVDLHKEKITGMPAMVHPGEILHYQLLHLKHFLNEMKRKRIKKFIVVHGKGSGKLKAEAQKLVRKEGYTTYDAPYHRFGFQGAFTAEKK